MKQMSAKNIKRKELLALPYRPSWKIPTYYDFIWLYPFNKKHESGYSLIAIVGYDIEKQSAEIAAVCDDIVWKLEPHPYNKYEQNCMVGLRMDMEYPSNVIRAWGSSEHYFKCYFEVGINVSSTDVTMKVKKFGGGV